MCNIRLFYNHTALVLIHDQSDGTLTDQENNETLANINHSAISEDDSGS